MDATKYERVKFDADETYAGLASMIGKMRAQSQMEREIRNSMAVLCAEELLDDGI